MAGEKKYTVQEVCDIFSKAYKKGGPAANKAFVEHQLLADMVEIHNRPPRRTCDGISTSKTWMDFENEVMRLVNKHLETKPSDLHRETAIAGKAETWVIGDYIILMEEYTSPTQKGKRQDVVIFPVVNGKITGYEAWSDPVPLEEDAILYAFESKARETVPYPDQTGIVFPNEQFQLDKETVTTIKKIAADMEAGNTRGGGQGLVTALRNYVADEVSIRHHPPRKYVDGKTTGKLWLDFEDAIIGMVTKAIEDTKPVETWFKTIGEHIVSHETRVFHQPDGSKKTCRSLRIWPMVNGKITGYDAWYDPMPDEVNVDIETMEAKVRKMIPRR